MGNKNTAEYQLSAMPVDKHGMHKDTTEAADCTQRASELAAGAASGVLGSSRSMNNKAGTLTCNIPGAAAVTWKTMHLQLKMQALQFSQH